MAATAADQGADYRRLLRTSLSALLVCAVIVAVCYFLVDRPVAFFVHDHDLSRFVVFQWLQEPPPLLQAWSPVVLAVLIVRRAAGPFRRWELTLLAACISLLIAVQFENTLKFTFGRYWPDTWTHDNPSLIRDNAYGFHPFHAGSWYASFPSGHTIRTVAIVSVVWIAYPRSRLVCAMATAAVVIGLIGMNYHFVGDIVAGGFVGGIIGMYVAHGISGVSSYIRLPRSE
jgi:membrane-associated phospholipid phosphatase